MWQYWAVAVDKIYSFREHENRPHRLCVLSFEMKENPIVCPFGFGEWCLVSMYDGIILQKPNLNVPIENHQWI